MKVFYWSPFISYVATTNAVINSIKSINKFSKGRLDCKIINVFKEWDEYAKSLKDLNIELLDLKTTLDIKKLPKGNFLKSRFTYFLTFFFSLFKLNKLLKEEKPEFFIIHLITFIPLILLIFFNYKTKFILRISGYPKLHIFRKIMWKLVANKIEKVFCPTSLTKELLIKKKIFDPKKIFLVRDPVIDVKNITNKKKQKIKDDDEILDNKKYILSIGRLTKQKNFSFLIKNFIKVSNNFKNLNLVILGEGEEKKKLDKIIKETKFGNKVFLLGKKENIYPYLKNSLFFILTSKWEDPGFVILESMFAKKIVFSSDCENGPKEIIKDTKNGFTYKKNNKEDFAKQFIKIMYFIDKNKKDKKKVLLSALQTAKLFTLFNHYKDIHRHLK